MQSVTAPVQRLHFGDALTPEGWRQDVRIVVKDGLIADVRHGVPPEPGDERHDVAVPGMPNVHSHAFQRAMAGLAERRGPGADDFWSWREAMYRFALTMSPEDMESVAGLLYVEMLESGFTRVGEFHYLHHDPAGQPYANPAEMAERIATAADESGIGLTLLPVLYGHATFGAAPPRPEQRRFICSRDDYLDLLQKSGAAVGSLAGANLGTAPHSLRAVAPDDLAAIVEQAGRGPVHIHAAEQTKEVDDCLRWSGKRPVEWLLDNAEVGENWCLIHATHLDDNELAGLARSGAVAGLCPITEANLGDGIFRADDFRGAGGRIGIGTDSNVAIGVAGELRQLEYAQRLAKRSRNILAEPGESTGEAVFRAALAGGSQALGQAASGFTVGASADIVSLRTDQPSAAGHTAASLIDLWIFSTGNELIDNVWVRGRRRVIAGRHVGREAAERAYRATMLRLVEKS